MRDWNGIFPTVYISNRCMLLSVTVCSGVRLPTLLGLASTHVMTVKMWILYLIVEFSVPSAVDYNNTFAGCCSEPAWWTMPNYYFVSSRCHPLRFPVAFSLLRVHSETWLSVENVNLASCKCRKEAGLYKLQNRIFNDCYTSYPCNYLRLLKIRNWFLNIFVRVLQERWPDLLLTCCCVDGAVSFLFRWR